jgi:hypothetical protein
MEKVEIRAAVIMYHCKKGMSPKEIHEEIMDALGEQFPPYSTVKNELLNLRGAGTVFEMMSGLGGQKRPPTMKLPKLCTIRSFATESETCEALLGKWV